MLPMWKVRAQNYCTWKIKKEYGKEKTEKAVDKMNNLFLGNIVNKTMALENEQEKKIRRGSQQWWQKLISHYGDGIREMLFLFMKNTSIRDMGSCHITSNDSGWYDVTDINKLVQGSSCSVTLMKKGKLK